MRRGHARWSSASDAIGRAPLIIGMTLNGSARSFLGPLGGPAQRTRIALKRYGVTGLARMVARRLTNATAACLTDQVKRRMTGKRGLEIGGPTTYLFGPSGYLPIYPLAARVDNVNFAAGQTTWENVQPGETFVFDPAKPPGTQFVGEATALPMVASGSYDFVLSSHTIEHTANPLRALAEWKRVLRPGGLLLLVAPDPTRTFDRKRPVTPLEHLIEDERRGTSETDLTHLDEILKLHDFALDPWAPPTPKEFAARSHRNAELRCLHHHVFDLPLLSAVVTRAGLRVLGTERALPDHLIVLAELAG